MNKLNNKALKSIATAPRQRWQRPKCSAWSTEETPLLVTHQEEYEATSVTALRDQATVL